MATTLPTKVARTLECKQGAVRAVRFNDDGNYCLTCGSDKSIKLWNPHKGTHIMTYTGHGYEVLDVAASCDNSQLTSTGADKMVILWDVSTGKMVRRFRGHVGRVNCVKFNEESTVIASGSIDNTVRLWDCRAKSKYDPIQILDEAKDGIFSIKLSDHEILTGSVDGRVRRYDLRVGELLVDYIGSPVTCVCFTKDGQCVLSSALDSTLRLLDKDTGELLGEYTGHKSTEFKTDCCLTNSDAHVVSGSEDGKIYFWDLVDGKVVHTLSKAGKGVVHSLSYHPSLPCMLSAAENLVKVWREEDYQED
ncbi:WD repeat domain-containing protein 83-like [Branchiostoma floridae x Branchiostoma japonicum]|uniref:WD repeat domain-containing protein 83 n=1 Tax=Branchiostoma floridae TaxID=7739 RepID=C3ZFQ7_BRAFL|eukprot:XP_002592654.1 hypothetical protein BRAFLDRAFT_124121 [Branchiostoma floridae]